ncbi:MAG: EsaB/YukD family protein [Acidimicrobiaceae bacterium]|nr:EsaB/YukD family protein [Acidimicrobiaceae bacterium]
MPASRTLLTIVTENRRFDLSVPSALPVRDWLCSLEDLRSASPGPGTPTLTIAGSAPLSPESSLDDADVVDGAVLHLVDVGSRQESE